MKKLVQIFLEGSKSPVNHLIICCTILLNRNIQKKITYHSFLKKCKSDWLTDNGFHTIFEPCGIIFAKFINAIKILKRSYDRKLFFRIFILSDIYICLGLHVWIHTILKTYFWS